jgi:hypothetical protein
MSTKPEMVQRVAKAIAEAVGERDPLDPRFLSESAYGDMARAAIAAMREPTEAMCAAGASASTSVRPEGVPLIWRAMIDEVLK